MKFCAKVLGSTWILAISVVVFCSASGSLLLGQAQHSGPDGKFFLRDGLTIRSSASVTADGETLSLPGYPEKGWYPAVVPTTVLAALVKQKVYPDPYFGRNLLQIPGSKDPAASQASGDEDAQAPAEGATQAVNPFLAPWWYRKQFVLPAGYKGKAIWLNFEGINYRANIWLNGKQIAKAEDIAGTWRTHEFDVTDAAQPGETNVLAVQVFPPTKEDLAITFVDWNPAAPDMDMGLWHDVYLTASGPVALRNAAVFTHVDSPANEEAHLTVVAVLRNATNRPVRGILRGLIEKAEFSQEVELGPKEVKEAAFAPGKYPGLNLHHPRLWWPAQMGTPNLYDLHMEFVVAGTVSDQVATHFGVREITSRLDQNNSLIFSINGKQILIRGGGWTPDMMLRENRDRLEDEFRYVQDLRLNTVRLEGKLETKEFFDLADAKGVLVMAGWSCCDRWERWSKWTPQDYVIAEQSLRDQMYRLRSHPSLLVWLNGSDNPPPADVEKIYLKVEQQVRWPNPVISSASHKPTTVTGESGVKMSGPYAYVPPSYWLEAASVKTKRELGGATGFNSETSMGAAVPPLESLRKMLPPEHLWPIDDWWNLHCGKGVFGNLNDFSNALNKRYGQATGIEDYALKSQLMTYEGVRAMFEAYGRQKYVSTGVIQWMLNNAWPSMIWHLYDYYLRPGGGYFGAKIAMEPIHPVYGYDDQAISVINSRYESAHSLSLTVKILNLDMSERFSRRIGLDVSGDDVVKVLTLPQIAGLSPTYFLSLKLKDDHGKEVGSNFYWLSTQRETLDWEKSTWYTTPIVTYADFTGLAALPQVKLQQSTHSERRGENTITHVMLSNPTDNLAFFVRLKVTQGIRGEEVLPILWEDNYVSLLPHETREVSATYRTKDLDSKPPAVEVSGWNLEQDRIQ